MIFLAPGARQTSRLQPIKHVATRPRCNVHCFCMRGKSEGGKLFTDLGNFVLRFLIKYVSRDEVELLAQGTNGAPEMRGHLANEPDDAPLFGYIRFRRKNVLVKYIPEAASRVIKGTYSDIIKMRKKEKRGRERDEHLLILEVSSLPSPLSTRFRTLLPSR